ncbi:MAG TPA: hypothetical protein VFV23_11900 [Verrucomicrobiae bacterium]|nr:hypothetical protein [Verrucomicrobiae bacterium]
MLDAIVGFTDFDGHARRKNACQAEARAENFENKRITATDELNPPANADSQRFQALRFFVVRLDMPNNAANIRRQVIQADEQVCLHRGDSLTPARKPRCRLVAKS